MIRYRARVLTPLSPDAMQFLDDALVVVDDGRFVEVRAYAGELVHDDLRPAVLLPGWVDAHLHYPQTRIIGSASGPLLRWLERSTFPEEERFADGAHAEEVAAMFCDRLAAAGTTLAFVYGSVHTDAAHSLFAELDRRGLRAIAGPVWMDKNAPEALLVGAEAMVAGMEELRRTWHGLDDDRLQLAVIPRFALTSTAEALQAASDYARAHGLWVSTHLAENLEECRVAVEQFGGPDYLSVYERFGLVHARSVYAHVIHLSPEAWDRFATAGAVVAHCPDSNAFLGSGGMPTGEVLARQIPLAVGTDVAAGRTFQVPRILSAAYDNALRAGCPLSLERLLWIGTHGGARALGCDRIGRIAAGHEADMVLYEVPWWTADAEGVLASVFFDHDRPGPLATWIRGRKVFGD